MRKVVVTGIGVVSPLGSDLETVWSRLKAGESGIGTITLFDSSEMTSHIAGEVEGFNAEDFIAKKEMRRMDRFSVLAIGAAELAVRDSGLDMSTEDPTKAGVIVSSGIGGLKTLEDQHRIMLEKGPSRCSPFMIPQMIANMAGGLIAIKQNMQGPNYAILSACASGTHSIGDCMHQIQRGDADMMLGGGTEASVTALGVGGFCALRALSTRNDDPTAASRPFEAGRDGFVIAEGAAVLVLEELERAKARGAKIYCELSGYGATCDAHHMTAPTEDGAGAARAIKKAISDSGVNPEDVDYINAHGTSTQLNDKMETKAIKGALGEDIASKVMVSSTKSMTGHLLGAAGGIEAAICALAIRDGVVPPTINHETPDPECDLDYVPNTAREADVKVCLSNSLGFGGHNASLGFKKLA